jgi:predicted nuclease of predicted toxin-antitoxin system
MRFLIDENVGSLRLASRLRGQYHDPVLDGDVGLLSMTDPRVLIYSIAQDLPVLRRDAEDFEDLHDLVMAAVSHHAGILIVRFDNDPRHNLKVETTRWRRGDVLSPLGGAREIRN